MPNLVKDDYMAISANKSKKSVTVIYFHSFSAEISLKCQVMGDYQINKCCMIFLKAPKVNLHVKEEHNRLHKNI